MESNFGQLQTALTNLQHEVQDIRRQLTLINQHWQSPAARSGFHVNLQDLLEQFRASQGSTTSTTDTQGGEAPAPQQTDQNGTGDEANNQNEDRNSSGDSWQLRDSGDLL